jgi:ligand-binding sensor domain-containing protein
VASLLVSPEICTGQIHANTAVQKEGSAVLLPPTPPRNYRLILPSSVDKNIRSVFQDNRGAYWVGTNGAGLYRYDKKTLTQFTIKDGLPDNQILHIHEDDLGNIWCGTGGFGVSKFDGLNFTTYSNMVNITNDSAKDWSSKPIDLWFHAGGGVFRLDNDVLDYLPFDSSSVNGKQKTNIPFTLSRYGVYCSLKDRKGNVWFGTQAEGVCRYDGKTITWFKEKGLAGAAVLGLFEDSKGNIWMGNNGAGLFLYDGQSLANITEEKRLGNPNFQAFGKSGENTLARVYSINEDMHGNIWIGTVDSGVWKLSNGSLTHFTTKDGLPSHAVNTIYRDNYGELWFGTDANGLCKFNGKSFYECTFD